MARACCCDHSAESGYVTLLSPETSPYAKYAECNKAVGAEDSRDDSELDSDEMTHAH
jgi:hypothetical protein